MDNSSTSHNESQISSCILKYIELNQD